MRFQGLGGLFGYNFKRDSKNLKKKLTDIGLVFIRIGLVSFGFRILNRLIVTTNQLLLQNYACKMPCTRALLTFFKVAVFTDNTSMCRIFTRLTP